MKQPRRYRSSAAEFAAEVVLGLCLVVVLVIVLASCGLTPDEMLAITDNYQGRK